MTNVHTNDFSANHDLTGAIAAEFKRFAESGDLEALAKSRPVVDYRADDMTTVDLRHLLALRTIVRRLAPHSFDAARTPAAWRDAALYILPALSCKNSVLRAFATALAKFLLSKMNERTKANKMLPVAVRESMTWQLVRVEVTKAKARKELGDVQPVELGQTLASAIVHEAPAAENATVADPVRRRRGEVRQEDRAAIVKMATVLFDLGIVEPPAPKEPAPAPAATAASLAVPIAATQPAPVSRAERKRREREARKAAGRKPAGQGFVLVN